MATLVVNKLRGIVQSVALKAPGYGDRRKAIMGDLAVLTGGQAIFKDLGIALDAVKLSDLGRAKKVIIEAENTTIVSGGGTKAAIDGRADQIRAEIESTTSDYDREKLQERLAKIAGGVAQISVALLRSEKAIEKLDLDGDEKLGASIVKNSLRYPLEAIAANAGVDGPVVVNRVRQMKGKNDGYDADKEEYCDLVSAGVIDPAKVVRTALQNAASVAALLLTTEALITEIPKAEEEAGGDGHDHHGMGGGMGGMGGMGGGMGGMGGMGMPGMM